MRYLSVSCSRAGAGPRPVAVERVTQRRLVDMLAFMARPEVIEAAKSLGARIAAEPDGASEVSLKCSKPQVNLALENFGF